MVVFLMQTVITSMPLSLNKFLYTEMCQLAVKQIFTDFLYICLHGSLYLEKVSGKNALIFV